jgi:hypothetical protein
MGLAGGAVLKTQFFRLVVIKDQRGKYDLGIDIPL